MEANIELNDGWIIWHESGKWTTDSGDIDVEEYLDDCGRYCVSVVDQHSLPDGDVFEYSALVTAVDLLDSGAALYVLPE